MKSLLKNYLFLNKIFKRLLLFFLLLRVHSYNAQIGNYVNNGSFEEYYSCSGPFYPISTAKYWLSVDSSGYGGGYMSTCNSKIPVNGSGFQYPHFGNSYILSTQYCVNPACARGYLKNRLKSNLKSGVQYCVKFYISIANESPRGMDGFAAYFGSNSIDTITHYSIPLTYITPQIKNAPGNVISDTLTWTAISGTFIATGTERNLLLGNFLADNAVTTTSINTPSYPQVWTDVYFDDVSCIEVDLPAYAGHDNSVVPGDSVFVGREPDFAIDAGCIWYKFPNMSTPINTISGMWVKPTVTTTYIVKQVLDCSTEKWDTVVIYMNPVGLEKLKLLNEELKIYPLPAKDFIELKISNKELWDDFNSITVYNNLGQLIKEEEISFKEEKIIINTGDFKEGVYSLQLRSNKSGTVSKRFVISR